MKKITLLALMAAAGIAAPQRLWAESEQLNDCEHLYLSAVHEKVRDITDISLFLVNKIENENDSDPLDIIVRKMEGAAPLVDELISQIENIKTALQEERGSEGVLYQALTKKLDVIKDVQFTLERITQILTVGLKENKSSAAFTFWNKIKGPLLELASPARLNAMEEKLNDLHSIIEDVNVENAELIKELLDLLGKIRQLTSSAGKGGGLSKLSKKLPRKNRKAFEGIPQEMPFASWQEEFEAWRSSYRKA